MRNRLIAVGVLAGGIALTGLAGSAYAAGASPAVSRSAPTTVPAKGTSPVAIVCVGKGAKLKVRPEKGPKEVVTGKVPGKARALVKVNGRIVKAIPKGAALPAPPSGATVVKATKDGKGHVKIGPLPKGVHCSQVKPGTKGVPLPPPAR
ncbi:hypothetical protein [Actinoallomurus iriomotensis]|uniref:Uncharacterized protein n=1 Tax=Actinoallomurus iriomotensis TaxID=478107 RepID=A0A9W6VRZ8_9ACTN|nr:hypothetical protein [Actinoallomurus iriomotensis]GLY77017.1 hypothetical protein Airi01_052840 [Actinoallomurus iriomotensis]